MFVPTVCRKNQKVQGKSLEQKLRIEVACCCCCCAKRRSCAAPQILLESMTSRELSVAWPKDTANLMCMSACMHVYMSVCISAAFVPVCTLWACEADPHPRKTANLTCMTHCWAWAGQPHTPVGLGCLEAPCELDSRSERPRGQGGSNSAGRQDRQRL